MPVMLLCVFCCCVVFAPVYVRVCFAAPALQSRIALRYGMEALLFPASSIHLRVLSNFLLHQLCFVSSWYIRMGVNCISLPLCCPITCPAFGRESS